MSQCSKFTRGGSRPARSWVTTRLLRFRDTEDGVLTIFALFSFLLILMVAGIGIDLMRFERDRTQLQSTLDRAVLAAADLDQTLDAENVVRDYFDKAGLIENLESVSVEESLGYGKVSATAATIFPTQFMHMSGVDTLTAPAVSVAEESIGKVEISLVLDVSGSMNSNNRLTNLKDAAKTFVDHMLASTRPGTLSISLIPYATQVNAGESLLSRFNVSDEHAYSHCVDFIADQFSRSTLDRSEPMIRTAHFDPFTYSENMIEMPVCPTRPFTAILPLTADATVLHNYINNLTAQGNTSIDIGAKWGTAMLDPSLQSVVSELIDEDKIDAAFEGRPTNYVSGDVLKVMIVMSDGENTNQYKLNPSLRTGLSNVWYNQETQSYSIFHDNGGHNYYWPDRNDRTDNQWMDHPYGNGTSQVCGYNSSWYYTCTDQEEAGTAVRLTYPELMAQVSLAWNARYNYEFSSSAWSQWYSSAFIKVEDTAKDQRTNHICDAAKDEGIVVYTVGFEAPRSGQRVLQRCASSDSHYYDATGLEITDAFRSIASSIRKLRLTQ
jgi:Flp pilus assembly protein TadG